MGRAADSLERTRHPMEPKPRLARRADSEFPHRGFPETGAGAWLSVRNDVARNCATRDLPFRADRDGLEHAPVAIPLALKLSHLPARVKLPRHGCETRHTNLERIRHLRELCLVRKVGLEEMLGLGNASDIRSSRVRRMRNLSLRRRPGRARQGN